MHLPTMEVQCPGSVGYATGDVEVTLTVQMDTSCPYEILLITPQGDKTLFEVLENTFKQRAFTFNVPQHSFVQMRGLGPGPPGAVHRITFQVDPARSNRP